mmetsp:Transcript_52065/g.151285  ORF Transcript_52065/g.151285 Transcript_52065/m.151285 type:complete len:246 (-) Transcript_52065:59-796(-)
MLKRPNLKPSELLTTLISSLGQSPLRCRAWAMVSAEGSPSTTAAIPPWAKSPPALRAAIAARSACSFLANITSPATPRPRGGDAARIYSTGPEALEPAASCTHNSKSLNPPPRCRLMESPAGFQATRRSPPSRTICAAPSKGAETPVTVGSTALPPQPLWLERARRRGASTLRLEARLRRLHAEHTAAACAAAAATADARLPWRACPRQPRCVENQRAGLWMALRPPLPAKSAVHGRAKALPWAM